MDIRSVVEKNEEPNLGTGRIVIYTATMQLNDFRSPAFGGLRHIHFNYAIDDYSIQPSDMTTEESRS